jgi:hypothetical protein
MRRSKLGYRSDGIGNVTLRGKYVARVRYYLRHGQMVSGMQTGEDCTERAAISARIDGDIESWRARHHWIPTYCTPCTWKTGAGETVTSTRILLTSLGVGTA